MPKKILYIEDDASTLQLITEVLEGAGYKVAGAKSGKEGLKKFSSKYDLILVDILMPDMSGWDVYQEIRKKDKKVKIAFLSAVECSRERMKKLGKEGVADYILKPIAPDDLIKRIKSILKK